MAQFLIRGIPEATAKRWKQKAKANGRSVQAELKELIVREGERPSAQETVEMLRRHRERLAEYTFLDPVQQIREDRDSR
jgi:plasmid stability protein